MKTHVFVRHGKSDWSMEGQPDIDRPLNPRGYTDAHRMGALLFQKIGKPGIMISSPAIRALSTALIFAAETGFPKSKLILNEQLYETDEKEYLRIASEIDDRYQSAIVFGHNPTISNVYSGYARRLENLPTCAILILQSTSESWKSLSRENTKVLELLTPRG